MKSRRRATLVALAREREAKHVAMLEGCAEMMPKPRVVPVDERQSDDCCEEETPFDERRCLTDDLGFDEDIPMQPRRGIRGMNPLGTISSGKPDVYSTSRIRPTYHRQQSKSLLLKVEEKRTPQDFDRINFSPLVRYRENKQRTLQRENEPTDQSAEQPSIPKTKSWGFIGDRSLDNPIHNRRKEKEWEESEKRCTSSLHRGINTKRLQRQRLRARHKMDTGAYIPVENENRVASEASTASIGGPSSPNCVTRPPGRVSGRSLQPEQSSDSHDLPSDEECNIDLQSLPSIDGDCHDLETKESITEGQDLDTVPIAASSTQFVPETSLAVEISRFKLLKSIHELQPSDTMSTVTNSTSSDSKRNDVPQTKEKNDSPFRRFALASSTNVLCDPMPSKEVMMIPINTTLSSLDGSVSTEGSITDAMYALETKKNTAAVVRTVSKATPCPQLVPRPVLQPASQREETGNVQDLSNRIMTQKEEPLEAKETKKSKWSFYNPKEIEALAGDTVVREPDNATERAPATAPLTNENVKHAGESNDRTPPLIQSPTPSIVEDPSCNISIDSDFSFSHLQLENDSAEAEKVEEVEDECTAIGSPCNSEPSDELTIPSQAVIDESSLDVDSPRQKEGYEEALNTPQCTATQDANSTKSNLVDLLSLSVDSGIDETESMISEEGPPITMSNPRMPVRVNLDQYRQTSILQENSLHNAVDAIKSTGTSEHPFGESRNSFLAETFEEASFENSLLRQQRAEPKEQMAGMAACLCMERPPSVQKVTHTVQIPPVNPAVVLSSPAVVPPIEQSMFLDRYSSAEEKSECRSTQDFQGNDKYDFERRDPISTESLGHATDSRDDVDNVLQALAPQVDPRMDAESVCGADDLALGQNGPVDASSIDKKTLHGEPMGICKSDVSKYLEAPLNSIARSMESVEDDSTARSDATSSTTSSDTGSYSSRTKSTFAREAPPLDMPDHPELNMYSFASTNGDSILDFEHEEETNRMKVDGTALVLAPNRRLVPYDEDVCGPKTREMPPPHPLPSQYLSQEGCSNSFLSWELVGTLKTSPEDFCVREVFTSCRQIPGLTDGDRERLRIADILPNDQLPKQHFEETSSKGKVRDGTETNTTSKNNTKDTETGHLTLQEVLSKVDSRYDPSAFEPSAVLAALDKLESQATERIRRLFKKSDERSSHALVWIPPFESADASALKDLRRILHGRLKDKYPLLTSKSAPKDGVDHWVLVDVDTRYDGLIPMLLHPEQGMAQLLHFQKRGFQDPNDHPREQDAKPAVQSLLLPLKPTISKDERRSVHRLIAERCKYLSTDTVPYKDNTSDESADSSTSALRVSWQRRMVQQAGRKRKRGQDNTASENPNVLAVLKKRQKEHLTALQKVAHALRCRPTDIGVAGIKDLQAVTYQFCTFRDSSVKRLWAANSQLNKYGIELGNCYQVNWVLNKGDLEGNQFDIIVRGVRQISVHEKQATPAEERLVPCDESHLSTMVERMRHHGFINFYGEQRVGSAGSYEDIGVRAFDIGRVMIQKDFGKAIDLLMTGREEGSSRESDVAKRVRQVWKDTNGDAAATLKAFQGAEIMARERTVLKGLTRFGKDKPLDAIRCLSHNMRTFWINAYQSYIWNRCASARIKKYGATVVIGDLYQADNDGPIEVVKSEDNTIQFSQIVLPLPGHSIQYPDNEIRQVYEDLMKQDGVAFDKNAPEESTAKGGYRRLIVLPKDVKHDRLSEDAVRFSFQLPKGSYATMLLRELMLVTATR
eukprot:Nitzschia sp. Nitz4//scaffold13_size275219//24678//30498//NITZ4_000840-RA/size275219-processed-gene-0.125-mRNA-1//-1//CDS//3329535912//955//frame0